MEQPADIFRVFSNQLRMRIINLLLQKPRYVCEMVSVLGASYSKLSNHLAILKQAGLVEECQESWWVQYSLRRFDPVSPVGLLLGAVRLMAAGDSGFERDLESSRSYNGKTPPEEVCCKLRRKRLGQEPHEEPGQESGEERSGPERSEGRAEPKVEVERR